jgi:hypothetical protein
MKFSALALILAVVVRTALSDDPVQDGLYRIPDGYHRQCCVKNEDESRKLSGGPNAWKHLGGYDYDTMEIDGLCASHDPKGYTCYTYKEVCEGGPNGLFSDGVYPTASNEVCANDANCYDPEKGGNECFAGTQKVFPDIWWSCMAGGGFFCGFKCKFIEACGDPHFETWDGQWYDFHGECDLVLIKAPAFGQGLGLDIHVRTTARYEYSYIESAAIKIGDDILEVSSFGEYAFNGVEGADMEGAKFADLYTIEHTQPEAKKHFFTIRTGGNEHIVVSSYKDLVSVKTNNSTMYNFGASSGMMGDFFEGKMLARDGTTIINDANEFGLEWQVQEEEPKLFRVNRAPQLPNQKCNMPIAKSAGAQSRRLGANTLGKDAAEAACAGVDQAKFDKCVYDVMVTGDVEMANIYKF